MKHLKTIFLIHAIISILEGIIVMINPHLLLYSDGITDIGLNLSKIIGILIFVLGIISYQLYRHNIAYTGAKMISLGIVMLHLLLGLSLYSMYNITNSTSRLIFIFHIAAALVLGYVYSLTIGKDTSLKD